MTASAFCRWLDEMKATFRDVTSDADCAALLGVSANTLSSYKVAGAKTVVALACAALLARQRPYA